MTNPAAAKLAPRRAFRHRLGRVLLRALAFMLLGAAANVAVAFALALLVDVSRGSMRSAATWTGEDEWTVSRWSRTGATYVLSVRESAGDWSPGQATGPPDAPNGGDSVKAWASAAADGQEEWLVLEYADAVVPATVKVYETCATGALTKVSVFAADGREVEAWGGTDPTPAGLDIGTSEVPLRVSFPTKQVKLYFDSNAVPGWNEVDAVALVGVDGKSAWARTARAGSTYAARFATAAPGADGGPSALAPAWTGFNSASQARPDGVRAHQHAVEARGWPMLALWGDVGSTQTPAPAPAAGPGTGGTVAAIPVGGTSVAYLSTGFLLTGGGGGASRGNGVLAPVEGQAVLPVRPIWGGFAANSLFYAVVLFLLYWLLTIPRRFVREVSRLRRGCCVACGYDLGYDFVPGCPECGWRRGEAGPGGHTSSAPQPTS